MSWITPGQISLLSITSRFDLSGAYAFWLAAFSRLAKHPLQKGVFVVPNIAIDGKAMLGYDARFTKSLKTQKHKNNFDFLIL